MKKIFIPTPLNEIIELPKDITHHILHVFRHNIEKPITVTGSDNRCGIYQINDEINGLAQASLIEYIDTPTSMHRIILVQAYLKGEKLEWVLQKATELNVDTVYLVPTLDEPLSNVLDIESESLKLVAYENEAGYSIKDALKAINSDSTNRDILICIGPEGGFQEKEINDIIKSSAQSVTLGHTILRAETAAIAAVSMIKYELEL